MKKGIIFDLDQTLVDSNVAKPYRSAHNWSIVYSLIPKFILYTVIVSLLLFYGK